MAKPQRNLILLLVPVALGVAWFAFGDRVFSLQAENQQQAAGEAHGTGDLKQAAASIVTAAKDRVASAKSDDEAMQTAQMSLEALRIVGTLGDFDSNPQAGQLLTSIQQGTHPAIVEALIETRLGNALRQWEQLNKAERAAAIDGFVDDVKQTGLTQGEGKLLMRLASRLDDTPDSKLLAKALTELLPQARDSKDDHIKRMAAVYEGIIRRLDLPGKPLEMAGTLLDGATLDWSSYRGKVVLVDFHASWCGPCRAEVPNILENYRAYHDKGFEVVGVNLDSNHAGAQKYVDETGFKFPVVFGEEPKAIGWNHPLAVKYGITGIPCVILVDRSGNVVSTDARGPRLGALLQQLLGDADRSPARETSRGEDSTVKPAGELPTDSGGVVPASAQEESSAPEPVPEDAPAAPVPPK